MKTGEYVRKQTKTGKKEKNDKISELERKKETWKKSE